MNDNRRLDSNKMLYHMDRVIAHFDKGERVAPIHIDCGIAKFCDIGCIFCVSKNTKILMADFTWKEIKNVKTGDMVIGFDEKIPEENASASYFPTKVKKTFVRSGRTHVLKNAKTENSIRITNEHPILCDGHRWREISKIKTGQKARYFTDPYETSFNENYLYKIGYLKGVCEGDGTICSFLDERDNYEMRKFKLAMKDKPAIDRALKYFDDLFGITMSTGIHKSKKDNHENLFVIRTDKKNEVNLIEKALKFRKATNFKDEPEDYSRGYLAGIFDSDGNLYDVLRIEKWSYPDVMVNIRESFSSLGFNIVFEEKSYRMVGGFKEIARFIGQCKPAITRKYNRFLNKEIPCTIEVIKRQNGDGGITEEVYNLETESGTYVANGFCVHNCFGKFQNPKKEYIQREALINFVKDAAEIGVKSIGFIGDGEPLCNPHVYEAIDVGHKAGLSLAISTNGVTLDTEEKAETVLRGCEWMRFCICAGDREGYIKNHTVDRFDKVVENVKRMVMLKKMKGYKCDIGLQAVYVPGLMDDDMIKESRLAAELGVDYVVIKQCSLPEANKSVAKVSFDVNEYDSNRIISVLKTCEEFSTDKTKIIPKYATMQRKGQRIYPHCPAVPLISEMSGNGDWFPCGYFFGDKTEYEKYKFGNIHEKSLKEIFESYRYWNIVEHFRHEFDSSKDCYGSCRLDSCNAFIDNYLKKPKAINFI